jgi:hypothetical protein
MAAVREFTQELPHTAPSDAWQRAALLTSETRLDLTAEPRVVADANTDAPKAEHPLFWAGYMLIDSGVYAEGETPPAPGEKVVDKAPAAPPEPAVEAPPAAENDPPAEAVEEPPSMEEDAAMPSGRASSEEDAVESSDQ